MAERKPLDENVIDAAINFYRDHTRAELVGKAPSQLRLWDAVDRLVCEHDFSETVRYCKKCFWAPK